MGISTKSLNFPHFLTFYLTFVLIILPFSTQSTPSIYDHLRQNSLPVGLFPKGITDFSYDTTNGHFQINLIQPCNAKFENQLHYDFNISGFLSFGKIGELSGISQQELFLWFPVKGIRVDVPSSGLIYFDVGVVDKQFSLSLFENPIECTAVDGSVDPLRFEKDLKVQSGKLEYKIAQGELRAAS
ncbi:uncharacterized protein LOC8274266 [Ricinus communis]|uniref:Uncharacterized protein n=1 Tax=Ricinus communis TaxID=3988 RepID=B9RM55_RICCO|nr:uncharacterized protein LOC8274266 [Ricinus communis]EEF47378.1 conserved hypothetical protein [Ricinus communis]|eukprot:XP_002514824.1 uncharacterized protein LOC8274266 [Ricinus communis]